MSQSWVTAGKPQLVSENDGRPFRHYRPDCPWLLKSAEEDRVINEPVRPKIRRTTVRCEEPSCWKEYREQEEQLWPGCCECGTEDFGQGIHRDVWGRYAMCSACYRECHWGCSTDVEMWDPIVRFWDTVRRDARRFRTYMSDECEHCGRRRPGVTLEADHRDGDRTNNTRENCRILCDECHKRVLRDVRSYAQRRRDVLLETGRTPGKRAARERRRAAARRRG
jgi:hypothetical protein